jgi:drug/metabolite transporter (DMT)-like permease
MNLELTVWGLEYTSSTNCVFILQLSIIVVPLIECIRAKTKPKKELVFVIIGVMIGMIIMCSEKGLNINVGDLLIFISMLANSLFVIVTSEFVKTSSEGALSIIQLITATVFGLILTCFTGFTIEVNIDSIRILIITGVIGSGIAYSMQLIAQKEVSTTNVSLTTTLQPVFGMIGATLIKDLYGNVEVISRMQLIGCIIILTSLVIYLVHQSRIINIRKKRLNV